MTGALLALLSALVWGSGDFSGGLAARRTDPLQVLALSAVSGLAMVVALALLWREGVPSLTTSAWAASAGFSSAIGIACLYRGLSLGHVATVAPTAAVVTAALPVTFSAATGGLPGPLPFAGFGLALIGIWLVATPPDHSGLEASGLPLAIVAGLGLGGFLVLIARTPDDMVFAPLVVVRAVMMGVAVALHARSRTPWPSAVAQPYALLAGILDAGGHTFYMFARRHARLDVAGVLASLYPVATVVLARVVSHERISRAQWAGVILCLAAVIFITL